MRQALRYRSQGLLEREKRPLIRGDYWTISAIRQLGDSVACPRNPGPETPILSVRPSRAFVACWAVVSASLSPYLSPKSPRELTPVITALRKALGPPR